MATAITKKALLPSFEIILFVFVFWTSLRFMPRMLNGDGDLGRHLCVGEYILRTRSIPTQDVFSHTCIGRPLVLHEWLSEIAFALAYRHGGLNGVAWFTASLLSLTYLLLALGIRAAGVSGPVASISSLAAFLSGAIHYSPRPHLFSLLFFMCTLMFCEMYYRTCRKRWLMMISPLMILWANCHGAFVIAYLVLACYVLGSFLGHDSHRMRDYSGALVLAILVSFTMNPYGVGLPVHVFKFMGSRFLADNTVEYLSPNFHDISAQPFAGWILLSILVMGGRGTQVNRTHLAIMGVWTMLALYSARNIPLYVQIAALTMSPQVEIWLVEKWPKLGVRLMSLDRIAPRASGCVLGVILCGVLVVMQVSGTKLDIERQGNIFSSSVFPVEAVDKIGEVIPRGNMFNEYEWGGYLLWRLYPRKTVFIDALSDFYGEEMVREYLDIINAVQGWEGRLERRKVDWVIIGTRRPLARELARSDEWSTSYQDETSSIWLRLRNVAK